VLALVALALASSAPNAAAQTKSADKPAGNAAASSGQEARIQRIEALVLDIPMGQKEPPLQLNLAQAMQAYNVPGVSVAVIDNYHIVWAKGYGVIGTGSSTPVGTGTLFQAGSISKPVAATATLALAEKGKLSLDEDVNQQLKTWKVPENEFTKDQKVTLRRLMSHTAGLTVHGFP
jgi:CubicO group peptidase (beta-lactamase class C family)